MATLTEQALGDISGIPGGFDLDIGLGLSPIPDPYVSFGGTGYDRNPNVLPYPITFGAGFGNVQPEQLGLTPEAMDDLIAYNDKLARLSMRDPLLGTREEYESPISFDEAILRGDPLPLTGNMPTETLVRLARSERGKTLGIDPIGVGQPAVDLGPKDQYLTLGGKLVEEFSPLSRPLLSLAALGYQFPEVVPGGYRNIRGIWSDEPATDIINEAIRENILRIPGGYGSPATTEDLIDTEIRGLEDLSDVQRGGYKSLFRRWADLAKRFSPISTAQAGSGFVPGKSVTVEVEQTPEEDFAITEALMQLDKPRIPYSLPPEVRGVLPEAEVQAPFILDQQVDPYTSITTLPIGEEGWTPTLLGDTLGGPETDQPRTNLDGTITYLTNEEAMASDVQRALDRAGRIGPAPPVTSVESQLQAITELAETDPTIAERYTTPGSQDLIDIATQVESFSAIQERADQERVERERADNRRQADEAAARQEQVRADNQRRAEESARAAENARSEREEAQRSADRAAEAAERSRSAQASRQARATAKRAEKAAAKERQATIQRQEDNRRRQATERAAAAQRQAEQQRERQAAARARNIAAENRLRSTMGGTNYAAYLRRGK